MSMHSAIGIWFLGALCGVAMGADRSYRLAVVVYLVSIVALETFGITGQGWLVDMLILAGAILLCFGVTGGMVELIWPTDKGTKK